MKVKHAIDVGAMVRRAGEMFKGASIADVLIML